MRALVFDGKTVGYRKQYAAPVAGEGEALIRVAAAGVCQTDFEIARGYMGFTGVLGHEFVGVVEGVGKGADVQWVGKRVCGEINCVCGKCEMCARGLSSHCFNRTVVGIVNHDGAFAELLRLPVRNLHAVPVHVTDEEAVFVEPLAAAFQILRQVQIEKRTKVCVLGDGRLGLLVAQVLQRTGCALTLVGKHESKLAVMERLKMGKSIRMILDGDLHVRREQDIVVDCTGRATGLERAMELVRPRGTIVMKTTVAAGKPLNLAPLVVDEVNLLGSRCGPFPQAIGALAGREVEVGAMVTKRVGLEEAAGLFSGTGAGGEGLKTVIAIGR
jgi:threonine dehydrogenase-like Zn-dependent dehydrogenase